jgi:hypothetical protein
MFLRENPKTAILGAVGVAFKKARHQERPS